VINFMATHARGWICVALDEGVLPATVHELTTRPG